MYEDPVVRIGLPTGQVSVPLFDDGTRYGTTIYVDGVPYHFERITRHELVTEYVVDTDPDYNPHCDGEGYCVILAPYSR